MGTEQPATMEIEDIRVLEVITNPMRMRLLYQLTNPHTVRELSEALSVPVTRLYHHVNLLESVGVIAVVETRKSGARLQRVYQATSTRFEPGRRLLEEFGDKQRLAEVIAGTVLDGARLDAVAGLVAHFSEIERAGPEPVELAGTLGRSLVALNRADAVAFGERLRELMNEMSELEDRDGEEYALSVVFFPMVGPVRGGEL